MSDSPVDPYDPGDPLASDPVLFELYMDGLDRALSNPEIQVALEEFHLSVATVRMRMVRSSSDVLGSAPSEFADYMTAADSQARPSGMPWELGVKRILSWVWVRSAFVGFVLTADGVVGWGAGQWAHVLTWFGVSMLVIAAIVWACDKLTDTGFGQRLILADSASLVITRDALMAAVSETELLAQVRSFINSARRDRFGHAYSVVGTPGLSEVYDGINRVPTSTAQEFDRLLSRFDGASIGIAGPRGSGKSMLLREYCEDTDHGPGRSSGTGSGPTSHGSSGHPEKDIRCMVSAPVSYDARDFVLHIFATFCRAVISTYADQGHHPRRFTKKSYWLSRTWQLLRALLWDALFFGVPITALIYWQYDISRWIPAPIPADLLRYIAVVTLLFLGSAHFLRTAFWIIVFWDLRLGRGRRGKLDQERRRAMARAARAHLRRVRYLQTYTSGWSGTLRLPGGAAEGQRTQGTSRSEQPLSYPEIMEQFRGFARKVAAAAHQSGHRVFVGIDELDKIGSAEQAERFLNEIKGIFGIPHVYFMACVSDDALTAFERRGLPLRDAFDSSFDEIIHVGPLSYAESRRLLYRRVIGLTEPYVALCHCLAGGLARDVIRSARQVTRAAANITGPAAHSLDTAYTSISASRLYTLLTPQSKPEPVTLTTIAAAVLLDEVSRKLRAVRHVIGTLRHGSAVDLQESLYDIGAKLTPGEPFIGILDLLTKPGTDEPPAVTDLRIDFATYAYYCATLQEVFTDQLDAAHMTAATSLAGPFTFDTLAAARNAFSIDTVLAWRLINRFRYAWSLEVREGPFS